MSIALLWPTPMVTGSNVSGDATHAQAACRMVHDGDGAPRV
jgi:hypothetical protein